MEKEHFHEDSCGTASEKAVQYPEAVYLRRSGRDDKIARKDGLNGWEHGPEDRSLAAQYNTGSTARMTHDIGNKLLSRFAMDANVLCI